MRARRNTVLGIVIFHLALIVFVASLPDLISEFVAASVYLPLWPLSALGMPVFGAAESWGWATPSVFGWMLLLIFWSASWVLIVFAAVKVTRYINPKMEVNRAPFDR